MSVDEEPNRCIFEPSFWATTIYFTILDAFSIMLALGVGLADTYSPHEKLAPDQFLE